MNPLDPTVWVQITDFIRTGGIIGALVALVVLLIFEILVPRGRLKDERELRIAAEKQRDEAIAGWKAQAEATKKATETSAEAVKMGEQTLQYVRDMLPRRRA